MLGGILGVLVGTGMFFLLSRFASAITGGGITTMTVLLCILQLFLPLAFLLLCAFFLTDELIFAGSGMAAALIAGAVIKLILNNKKNKK